MLKRKSHPYLDAKATSPVTCEALFTMGERDADAFSRTIALRYLTKRMVYSPSSRATGKGLAPKTLLLRRTGSSKHLTAWYVASDIEDIIQDAWILFMTATTQEGVKKYSTGNKLHDTCNACRDARNNFQRRQWAERKRLDVLAVRMQASATKERSRDNRWYDEELDALLTAVRLHGYENQCVLAQELKISAGELCKRLSRLRERCERMERMELANEN